MTFELFNSIPEFFVGEATIGHLSDALPGSTGYDPLSELDLEDDP